MINTIPNWLQNAINFINQKFPNDKDANLCLLYGLDYMIASDGVNHSDGKYNALTNTIYLADFKNLSEHYGGVNTSEDIAILNLFHEYRHHQQYMYGYRFGDDEDAETFAMDMWQEYLIYENSLKV